MAIVNILDLTAQLLTVSAVTKVLVDLMKLKLHKVKISAELKYILSMIIPVLVTILSNISIFETTNMVLFYVGSVAAGLIAGLGSNFIHEAMKILQVIKTLKK